MRCVSTVGDWPKAPQIDESRWLRGSLARSRPASNAGDSFLLGCVAQPGAVRRGVREKLRALAKLAEIDGAARDLDAELVELPARLEAMRGDVQTLESMLAAERAQLSEAEALLAERQQELQARNEALTRAKAKGSKARNLKEADAAEREVDAARRSIKERQEELERIQETIAKKTESLSEREQQFEEARTMLQEEEKTGTARLAEVNEQRSHVVHGRDEQTAKLPKNIVKRYERLHTKSKYAAVAIVTDGTCVSCRFRLPPQLYIEVQRGEEFHECPQCRAFLVYTEIATV